MGALADFYRDDQSQYARGLRCSDGYCDVHHRFFNKQKEQKIGPSAPPPTCSPGRCSAADETFFTLKNSKIRTPFTMEELPLVKITESIKQEKIQEVEPVEPTSAEKPSQPEEKADPEVAPKEDEAHEGKLREQFATFRAQKDVEPTTFSYHQGDHKKPVPLAFQEIENDSFVRIRIKAPDAISREKADELARQIHAYMNVDIKNFSRKVFEVHVYFLKYRRLERRDKEALEALRKVALAGGMCFIFVDEQFDRMSKPIEKLRAQSLLPPGAIFLPWEDTFTDDQKKAVVGLTVSAKFQDVTKSARYIDRVLIPSLRK